MTIINSIDSPKKLYLDRLYASGIPNNIINPVETEAVAMHKMNASSISGSELRYSCYESLLE
jgi:hypothetical protein